MRFNAGHTVFFPSAKKSEKRLPPVSPMQEHGAIRIPDRLSLHRNHQIKQIRQLSHTFPFAAARPAAHYTLY